MTIWEPKEEYSEGDYLGELDEETIKQVILEIKSDINIDGTLVYFGMLPIF
jgi:hypothetical protein